MEEFGSGCRLLDVISSENSRKGFPALLRVRRRRTVSPPRNREKSDGRFSPHEAWSHQSSSALIKFGTGGGTSAFLLFSSFW